MPVKIKNQETILFAGDSITDTGRREAHYPLGCGYVRVFNDLMTIREPEKQIKVINKGISGNTVRDLEARWTDDVLNLRPDWLSILIGINDLAAHLAKMERGVSPEQYEIIYRGLLERTRKALPKCRIILLDPFYISRETHKDSPRYPRLKALPTYAAIVHKLSKEFKTRLVLTHDMFQKTIRTKPADLFCPEPVHPNALGHLAIAEAVYSELC